MPQVNILITSNTVAQANIIIQEKIDEMLTSELSQKVKSPILQQMRKDGFIEFKKEDSGSFTVKYGNGSKVFGATCGISLRGKRSNIIIADESAIMNKEDYLSIARPTLEPYNINGLYIKQKEILLTSAKTRDNWMWSHLVDTVNKHYQNNTELKYGFFAGDIYTAIASGIKDVASLESAKSGNNPFAFQTEHLNIWLGNKADAIFKYSDFHEAQTSSEIFIPVNAMEYTKNGFHNIEKNEDEIRILSCDIAIVGGTKNDNTVFMLGRYNIKTGKRSIDYMRAYNGLKSNLQVAYLKRLYYDYGADYVIFDTAGAGNPIFDYLTEPSEDREFNRTMDGDNYNPYPALNLCNDKRLQISTDSVINEKKEKVRDVSGEEVLIPYNGSTDINSQAHYSVWNAIREKKIELLKSKGKMESELIEKDPLFIIKDSDDIARILMSNMETDSMIDEIISLEVKRNDLNKLSVKEKRSGTKDRYMTFAMFNLLCDKIAERDASQENNNTDFNESEWAWLKKL